MSSDLRNSYLYSTCRSIGVNNSTQSESREIDDLEAEHENALEKLKLQQKAEIATISQIHKTCEFTGMPVNMITALWQMAEKRKDYVVLSDMLKFDYLPEYCLKQARNIKDSAVRCAYLLRPETTNRRELLNLENRSSVFAAVAELGSTDTQVRDAILKRMREKPTKVLANGVLNSGLADTECIIEALRTLAKHEDGISSVNLGYRSNFDSERGIDKAIVRSSEDFTKLTDCFIETGATILFQGISMRTVAKENQREYTPALVKWFEHELTACVNKVKLESNQYSYYRHHSTFNTVVSLLLSALKPDKAPDEILVKHVCGILEKHWIQLLILLPEFSELEELAHIVNYKPSYKLEPLTGMAKEACTAKGTRLDKIVHKLTALLNDDADPREYHNLMVATLSNNALYSLEHSKIETILDSASPVAMRCAVALNGSIDVLKNLWLTVDNDLASGIWNVIPLSETDKLNMLTSLLNAAPKIRKQTVRNYYGYNSRSTDTKITELLETMPSREFFKNIPWETIRDMTLNSRSVGYKDRTDHDEVDTNNFTHISGLMDEVLGDDQALWESYYNLSQNWTGSFGDLLEAVKLL